MSSPTVGLLAGLLLSIAIVAGGLVGFLLAIVLGGGGFLIGLQHSGDVDVLEVLRGRRG